MRRQQNIDIQESWEVLMAADLWRPYNHPGIHSFILPEVGVNAIKNRKIHKWPTELPVVGARVLD